jgi:hypothetical protein
VVPTTPRELGAVERLPRRIHRDGAFAVFADDGRPVELPADTTWRILIIGSDGEGRTTTLTALEKQWHREGRAAHRRFMSVDVDEGDTTHFVDDANTDVVVAIDPLTLRNSFDHWAHVVRRSRTGLLLGRSSVDHVDLLGAAPPPRPYAITPGRGEWVRHGHAMGIVQVTV